MLSAPPLVAEIGEFLESAFVEVSRRAACSKISHRTAAMSIGVEKVRAGKQLRGLFP